MKPQRRLRRPIVLRRLTAEILKTYARIFYRFRVNKNTHVPDGAIIFAANHPTTIDPFLIYALYPNAKMMINAEVFQLRALSWLMQSLGHIATNKTEGGIAYATAKQQLMEGHSLVVFPEGGISGDMEAVGEFKTGVIRLALETNTPIVPVGISVNKRGAVHLQVTTWRRTRLRTVWYLHGPYRITIGEGVTLVGSVHDRDSVRALAANLRKTIDTLRTTP